MLDARVFLGAWIFGAWIFLGAWTLGGWTSCLLTVGRWTLCGLAFGAVDFGIIDFACGTALLAPPAAALTEAAGSVAPTRSTDPASARAACSKRLSTRYAARATPSSTSRRTTRRVSSAAPSLPCAVPRRIQTWFPIPGMLTLIGSSWTGSGASLAMRPANKPAGRLWTPSACTGRLVSLHRPRDGTHHSRRMMPPRRVRWSLRCDSEPTRAQRNRPDRKQVQHG
jgi:hypothetical protein